MLRLYPIQDIRKSTGQKNWRMQDVQREQMARDEALLAALVHAIKGNDGNPRKSSVNVTQNIYANETSYAGQQREAARNFWQIARAMG